MRKLRRMLVAVKELDAKTFPALVKAAQLARACGAEVELFHALATPVYADVLTLGGKGIVAVEAELRQRALRRLEAMADGLRRHSLRVSVAADWDFPSYEAIIRRAVRIKADLVVVGRHDGRHRVPWLLRLTDWELVRLSPIPVLLVKDAHAYRHPALLVAVDPTHSFAKPLRLDDRLLDIGSMISERMRGTLHAVHAYARLPVASLRAKHFSPELVVDIERQAALEAGKHFERSLRGRVARSRRYLIGAHPIDAIREVATKSRSAIVVMGAISRSGIRSMLIGNTAEKILDELTCDILIVKPQKFRIRVRRTPQGPRVVLTAPMGQFGYY